MRQARQDSLSGITLVSCQELRVPFSLVTQPSFWVSPGGGGVSSEDLLVLLVLLVFFFSVGAALSRIIESTFFSTFTKTKRNGT